METKVQPDWPIQRSVSEGVRATWHVERTESGSLVESWSHGVKVRLCYEMENDERTQETKGDDRSQQENVYEEQGDERVTWSDWK